MSEVATESDSVSPRAGEPSDIELVRRYRGGDARAFEELHRRYVGPIFRLVKSKLGDALLAEDVSQETFLKALRQLDSMDEEFNFGGWIHTVARNLCYDELRRRRRDLRVEAPDGEDQEDLMDRLPATSGRFDPVEVSESNDMRRRIWEVAQRLPEKYRLVLTLRELQGLSYRQIARSLRISESAVETLVYRARLRFKEEYMAAEGEQRLDCAQVKPLLAPYLSGKLRRAQEDMVREHLATCVKCSRMIGGRVPAASKGEDP
ncbi:MAG TPA: RNA polymerase sigma factor [Candidatus Dormibacteraeota bacterium]